MIQLPLLPPAVASTDCSFLTLPQDASPVVINSLTKGGTYESSKEGAGVSEFLALIGKMMSQTSVVNSGAVPGSGTPPGPDASTLPARSSHFGPRTSASPTSVEVLTGIPSDSIAHPCKEEDSDNPDDQPDDEGPPTSTAVALPTSVQPATAVMTLSIPWSAPESNNSSKLFDSNEQTVTLPESGHPAKERPSLGATFQRVAHSGVALVELPQKRPTSVKEPIAPDTSSGSVPPLDAVQMNEGGNSDLVFDTTTSSATPSHSVQVGDPDRTAINKPTAPAAFRIEIAGGSFRSSLLVEKQPLSAPPHGVRPAITNEAPRQMEAPAQLPARAIDSVRLLGNTLTQRQPVVQTASARPALPRVPAEDSAMPPVRSGEAVVPDEAASVVSAVPRKVGQLDPSSETPDFPRERNAEPSKTPVTVRTRQLPALEGLPAHVITETQSASPHPAKPATTLDEASLPIETEMDAVLLPQPRPTPEVKQIAVTLQAGGDVEVRIREHAGTVQVSVHTSNPEMRTALRQDLPQLVTRLERQGLEITPASPDGGQSSGRGSAVGNQESGTTPSEAVNRIARSLETSASTDDPGNHRQQNQKTPWEVLMEHARPRAASVEEWNNALEAERWQTA